MKLQRNTIQRRLIFDTVSKLKNHPTPDEVYNEIHINHPNISRSTVYRNLSVLCDNGQVLKVRIPNAADHVDHNCHSHYHIYCENCGNVCDADMQYIPELNTKVKNSNGFEILGHDIIFIGICPDCKAKESNGKK